MYQTTISLSWWQPRVPFSYWKMIHFTLLTSDFTTHSMRNPILISDPMLYNRWHTPLHHHPCQGSNWCIGPDGAGSYQSQIGVETVLLTQYQPTIFMGTCSLFDKVIVSILNMHMTSPIFSHPYPRWLDVQSTILGVTEGGNFLRCLILYKPTPLFVPGLFKLVFKLHISAVEIEESGHILDSPSSGHGQLSVYELKPIAGCKMRSIWC